MEVRCRQENLRVTRFAATRVSRVKASEGSTCEAAIAGHENCRPYLAVNLSATKAPICQVINKETFPANLQPSVLAEEHRCQVEKQHGRLAATCTVHLSSAPPELGRISGMLGGVHNVSHAKRYTMNRRCAPPEQGATHECSLATLN